MKAVLLLLTSFFISLQLSFSDTIVMRDGRVLHGRVEEFGEQKLKYVDAADNSLKELSLLQLQTLYFSNGIYDGQTVVDDQFCIEQMTAIEADKKYIEQSTLLRSIKSVDLSSPYTWTEEEVLTYYSHDLLPESVRTYGIDYNVDYEEVEVVDATLVTAGKRVVRLPETSFKKYAPYSYLPHLNRLMRLEVKLPETVKGSLLNLRVRKTRSKKIPFSNFYLDYKFSSTLPVKRSEFRVIYSEKAEWTLNNAFNTASEEVRYLHSKENGKVVKSWWMENILTPLENSPVVSVAALESSVPEAISLYSTEVGNELLKIGNKKLMKKRPAEKGSLDHILSDFSRNFIQLPSNGIHFATNPKTSWFLQCGTAETLAILLLYELELNGFKADLLLCRDDQSVDEKLFSFQLFDYPVIRVHGEDTVFITPDGRRYDRNVPVYGYCVYGSGLREKVTVDEVRSLVHQHKVKLRITNVELEEGGSLHVEGEMPLFPGHTTTHTKELVAAFKKLCPNVENLKVREALDKKTVMLKGEFEQQVSVTGEKELLMFDLPDVNGLIKAYPMCNVEVEIDCKMPAGYQLSVLPVELNGEVRRRFFPTMDGFQVFIEGGSCPENLSKLIIMKNKDSRN